MPLQFLRVFRSSFRRWLGFRAIMRASFWPWDTGQKQTLEIWRLERQSVNISRLLRKQGEQVYKPHADFQVHAFSCSCVGSPVQARLGKRAPATVGGTGDPHGPWRYELGGSVGGQRPEAAETRWTCACQARYLEHDGIFIRAWVLAWRQTL